MKNAFYFLRGAAGALVMLAGVIVMIPGFAVLVVGAFLCGAFDAPPKETQHA